MLAFLMLISMAMKKAPIEIKTLATHAGASMTKSAENKQMKAQIEANIARKEFQKVSQKSKAK